MHTNKHMHTSPHTPISPHNAFRLTDEDVTLLVVPMFHAHAWGYPFSAIMNGSGKHTKYTSRYTYISTYKHTHIIHAHHTSTHTQPHTYTSTPRAFVIKTFFPFYFFLLFFVRFGFARA